MNIIYWALIILVGLGIVKIGFKYVTGIITFILFIILIGVMIWLLKYGVSW